MAPNHHLFFQIEKSLTSFTRLCYFSTTPACPPPLKSIQGERLSPHDPDWRPSSHDNHISQCISTAQEQPTASPKSHFLTMLSKLLPRTQGQSGLTGTSRDLGGSCRLLKLTSRGIRQPSGLGRALKLAPAQVTKAG